MSDIGLFSGTALGLYGLSGLGLAGCVAGAGSLLEKQWAMGGCLLGFGACIALYAVSNFNSRYQSAKPNEWMLVIENGECKRAAVGLVNFRSIGQSIVKFPSKMFSLEFQAMQVTKEMQGVKVTGFANWSVFREDEGPYKAYKTFDGFSANGQREANDNIRKLVEAILRHTVSGLTINEVMTQRNKIREQAKEQVLEQTKGWGVWIETIEITDVLIMSNTLFKNMQAEHRNEMRLKAEKLQMKTDLELAENRRENDLEMSKANEEAETQKFEVRNAQKLLRAQRQFETKAEQHKITLKELEQQQELEVQQLKMRAAVDLEQTQERQNLEQLRAEHSRKMDTQDKAQKRQMREFDLALENSMTPMNLKMRMLQSLDSATSRVNYDMKVVNMGQMNDLASMIPGMAGMWKETMEAVDASL